MIYLILGGIALSFGLLGFLLNAFYFSKAGVVDNLAKELEQLRKILKDKEKRTREAQEEVARSRVQIHLLEQQLDQRNKECNALHFMTLRRDEEIRRLKKIAEEMWLPSIQTEDGSNAGEQPNPAFSQNELEANPSRAYLKLLQSPASAARDAAGEGENQHIPLWKKNLNDILSILDTIEKEVKSW